MDWQKLLDHLDRELSTVIAESEAGVIYGGRNHPEWKELLFASCETEEDEDSVDRDETDLSAGGLRLVDLLDSEAGMTSMMSGGGRHKLLMTNADTWYLLGTPSDDDPDFVFARLRGKDLTKLLEEALRLLFTENGKAFWYDMWVGDTPDSLSANFQLISRELFFELVSVQLRTNQYGWSFSDLEDTYYFTWESPADKYIYESLPGPQAEAFILDRFLTCCCKEWKST